MQAMQRQLSSLVGAMRPGRELLPVVVVGGGAPLCGDTLPGVSRVVRPLHADVANAVGAAIPQAREGLGEGTGAGLGDGNEARVADALEGDGAGMGGASLRAWAARSLIPPPTLCPAHLPATLPHMTLCPSL